MLVSLRIGDTARSKMDLNVRYQASFISSIKDWLDRTYTHTSSIPLFITMQPMKFARQMIFIRATHPQMYATDASSALRLLKQHRTTCEWLCPETSSVKPYFDFDCSPFSPEECGLGGLTLTSTQIWPDFQMSHQFRHAVAAYKASVEDAMGSIVQIFHALLEPGSPAPTYVLAERHGYSPKAGVFKLSFRGFIQV